MRCRAEGGLAGAGPALVERIKQVILDAPRSPFNTGSVDIDTAVRTRPAHAPRTASQGAAAGAGVNAA